MVDFEGYDAPAADQPKTIFRPTVAMRLAEVLRGSEQVTDVQVRDSPGQTSYRGLKIKRQRNRGEGSNETRAR